jgi:hypothetical protein
LFGTESGLVVKSDEDDIAGQPSSIFSPGEVDGKKVWAHWCWAKYGLDFLKQDGEWKIWHFHCYEVNRTPFEENWVTFAAKNAEFAKENVMYFGEDGKPVFMPEPDRPSTFVWEYGPHAAAVLEPRPPEPYATFDETFEY